MKSLSAVLGALILVSNAWGAGVSMTYSFVWSKFKQKDGLDTLRVEISNDGKGTAGILHAGDLAYPIELPQGSHKSIEVYANASNQFGETVLKLETPEGTVLREVEYGAVENPTYWIGVVTQDSGSLSGLKAFRVEKSTVADTYCKPEEAPSRSLGFSGLSAVVLSKGAERMPDSSVEALRLYALRGGTIVFCGGASSPILRDARWKPVLPLTVAGTINVGHADSLRMLTGKPLSGVVSLTDGRLVPDADVVVGERNQPFVVQHGFGLGRVVVMLFDPFEEPVRTWDGRSMLFYKLISTPSDTPAYLDSFKHSGHEGQLAATDDPFNVKPVPVGTVFGILALFMVMAVPLNFFLLGKMRKKEFAWGTLPVLSLAFSGAIFASASGLYRADSARATSGVLIVQHGGSEGVFLGTQQLFFPRAGRFDLGFQDVEMASQPRRREEFGMRPQAQTPDLVDIGQVVAPAVEVTNLSFREYALSQKVPVTWSIRLTGVEQNVKSGTKFHGTIYNGSPFALHDSKLFSRGRSYAIGELAPGETIVFDGEFGAPVEQRWYSTFAPPKALGLALEAKAGLPVGSTFGKEAENRRDSRLLYVWSGVSKA